MAQHGPVRPLPQLASILPARPRQPASLPDDVRSGAAGCGRTIRTASRLEAQPRHHLLHRGVRPRGATARRLDPISVSLAAIVREAMPIMGRSVSRNAASRSAAAACMSAIQ